MEGKLFYIKCKKKRYNNENGGRKMTLEEQIKHYRKQAGLSQEKMAEV